MKRSLLFLLTFCLAAATCLSQPEDLKIKSPIPGETTRVGLTSTISWDTLDTKGNRTHNSVFEFQWSQTPDGPWNLLAVGKNQPEFKDVDSRNPGRASGRITTVYPRQENFYLRMRLKDNPDVNTTVGPLHVYVPPPVVPDSVLEGSLRHTITLSSAKSYGLKAVFYVADGGCLRIEPGTVIYGDPNATSAICVNRGGKIYANGTPELPIVMTSGFAAGSRDRGDWGGLLIMGNAETNLVEAPIEGGISDDAQTRINAWFGRWNGVNNNEDSSGVVRYVRIEFAGIAESPDNELNSLTMGAVGSRTIIENIMVSYAGDDAYEWFGGTVDAKYLIALNTIDDDLDSDNGYSGRVQHALVYRFPAIADQSNSEAFESDNDSKSSENQPFTRPVFSNITVIGPVLDTTWTAGTGDNKYNAKFLTAVQIRRNSRLSLFNSVIAGWPGGVELTNQNTIRAASNDSIKIRYNNFYGIKNDKFFYFGSGTNPEGNVTTDWLKNPAFGNEFYNGDGNVGALAHFEHNLPFPVTNFNPLPKADAPYLTTARFDVPEIEDPFFDKVAHRGAFGTHRWDLPWAEYDPVNKDYSVSVEEREHKWAFEISASPNPASDAVRILYQLPTDDVVTLKFYNSLGGHIATFTENEMQSQGFYEFIVNTAQLPVGVYYIQVQGLNGTATQQINVMR